MYSASKEIYFATQKICQYKENTSVDDCHRMMLKLWIKRKSPVPSWSALVEAFSSEVIHRFDIANEIKDNYKMNLEMEAVGKRPKGNIHVCMR